MAAQNVGTGAAGQVIADIIKGFGASFMNLTGHYYHRERNVQHLQGKLDIMKSLLNKIFEFEIQQRVPQGTIPRERMIKAIEEATQLISRSEREQNILDWLRSPLQVSEMNEKSDKLFGDLQTIISLFQGVGSIFSDAPSQETAVPLLPMPEVGLVGRAIESAETQLQTWINAEDPRLRVIPVYGMPGVGKTTVLRKVHNFFKRSNAFNVVIWLTVSQDCKISDLQGYIAGAIDLDLSSTYDTDSRSMNLSVNLENTKFLLILDDIWNPLNLQELGVAFGTDKGSKVIFSTRNRELAKSMGAEAFVEVKQLSKEEGRELFERVAFRGGNVPQDLKDYAGKIADECEGLPLAITVVAAAMRSKKTVEQWDTSFSMMKITDPGFPNTHPGVDKELYRKLRWSYDDLAQTPNLQNCFLYGAMYPEDEEIWVEELVRMWIAERFVQSKEATYSMDMRLGYRYVELLIDRGLFQSVNFEKQSMDIIVNKPVKIWKKRFIRLHDVIRDMAIHIGEEKNYLCRAGLQVEEFPRCSTQGCKRMSLRRKQVKSLSEDFLCTQLVSLMLSENPLGRLPTSLTHLRVLDLSSTQIESVPTSLTQLEFLTMSHTCVKELPKDIGHLCNLQFLDLSYTQIESVPTSLTHLEFLTMKDTCIKELPKDIGNLSNLQFLDISECKYLTSLPTEISQLTSLKRLHLSMGKKNAVEDPADVIALTGLKNLVELHLYMFFKFERHEIMGTIFGSWVEMRHLYLNYNHMNAEKCDLPQGMQNMKKLESLVLFDYGGKQLPNWICEFQQLRRLELDSCNSVKELPPLERLSNLKFLKLRNCSNVRDLGIGRSVIPSKFSELEMLHLSEMSKMSKLGVLEEETLPKLRVLKIKKCLQLKKLPKGMEKLSNLKALYGHRISWWDNLICEDYNMKMCLQEIFKEI